MEIFILFLSSVAAAGMVQSSNGGTAPRPTPARDEGEIQSAIHDFEPYLLQQLDGVRSADPEALSTWQTAAAWLPYLTEMVAGWYALQDPEVPNEPKLLLAGAIAYLIAPDVIPGWLDDGVAMSGALLNMYEYIEPKHIDLAKKWLEAHGVEPKPFLGLGKRFEK